MSDGLDEQIATLEQEIEAMRGPMASLHDEFVRSAAVWAGRCWSDYAAATVARNADLARRRAEDGSLGELKQRIEALVDEASVYAAKELAQPSWPHLASDITAFESDDHNGASWRYYRSRFRVDGRNGQESPPSVVSRSTDRLLTRVQGLLSEYDFGNQMMRYEWDETMLTAMKAYAAQHETLVDKRRDLAEARRTRDEGQAAALWDSA